METEKDVDDFIKRAKAAGWSDAEVEDMLIFHDKQKAKGPYVPLALIPVDRPTNYP